MERARSLSRCVAVAAHGRRCQQSPFRGGPYCWHHTQSRKIPAPSRVAAGASPVRLVVPSVEDDRTQARVRGADESAGEAVRLELATRLADALGPRRTHELLRFLENPGASARYVVLHERAEREPARARGAGRA